MILTPDRQVRVRPQPPTLWRELPAVPVWEPAEPRESVPATPRLTVHTHGPTSQSTALCFARGETRKPVIINLLSRKVPGLILHLVLGTERRHSYASQTLVTLIWGRRNYCAGRGGSPQKTTTCDRNKQPLILHTTREMDELANKQEKCRRRGS